MGDEYPYLLPEPDTLTQGYWDALKEHKIVLQRCVDCQTFQHPPDRTCRFCLGEEMSWQDLGGRGTLYTYVIVTQGILGPWRGHDPYNVIQVLPDEVDPKTVSIHNNATYNVIYGNAVEVENGDLKVGMAMEAVFDDVADDVTILRWKPPASTAPRKDRALERRFRKALFSLVGEAADAGDLRERFDAFIADVRTHPLEVRPYPDEVRDTLLALSLRPEHAAELHRRYQDARVGLDRQPA